MLLQFRRASSSIFPASSSPSHRRFGLRLELDLDDTDESCGSRFGRVQVFQYLFNGGLERGDSFLHGYPNRFPVNSEVEVCDFVSHASHFLPWDGRISVTNSEWHVLRGGS